LAWRSSGEWSGERAEHEAGFFFIRDSVDHVAGRLDLTRYTIYNYLG
jgi:predicted transcriptional regulator YheO